MKNCDDDAQGESVLRCTVLPGRYSGLGRSPRWARGAARGCLPRAEGRRRARRRRSTARAGSSQPQQGQREGEAANQTWRSGSGGVRAGRRELRVGAGSEVVRSLNLSPLSSRCAQLCSDLTCAKLSAQVSRRTPSRARAAAGSLLRKTRPTAACFVRAGPSRASCVLLPAQGQGRDMVRDSAQPSVRALARKNGGGPRHEGAMRALALCDAAGIGVAAASDAQCRA